MKGVSLKEQKKHGVLLLVLGLALLVLGGYLMRTGKEAAAAGFYNGLGCSVAACGAVRLLRCRRLSKDPERAADYEAMLKGERTAYLAGKARSLTFFVCLYVQLAAGLIALLAFDEVLIGKTLCMVTSAQALIYCGLFWYFNKRY